MMSYDKNNDGRIDIQEFMNLMRAFAGSTETQAPPPPRNVPMNYQQNWYNNKEWNTPPPGQGYQKRQLEGNWSSTALQIFMKHDRDQSGKLELHEFPAMCREVYQKFNMQPPNEQESQYLMTAFDADGDGRMSAKEFIDMMGAFANT